MDFTYILVGALYNLFFALWLGRLFRSDDPGTYRKGVLLLWIVFCVLSIIFN